MIIHLNSFGDFLIIGFQRNTNDVVHFTEYTEFIAQMKINTGGANTFRGVRIYLDVSGCDFLQDFIMRENHKGLVGTTRCSQTIIFSTSRKELPASSLNRSRK